MIITLESTSKIVKLNESVDARIWEGTTITGIKVHCYITRIAIVPNQAAEAEFAKELEKQKTPSAAVEAIPLRLIL